MESQPNDALGAELQQATGALQDALSEACSSEIRKANTSELVRVEEVLQVAAQAARKAVSLRRAKRNQRSRVIPRVTLPGSTAAGLPESHRVFIDSAGVTWDAFAVHPSSETTAKARLPEPYQSGWLSFDSGTERRRLSPIPDDWRTMSEDALRTLCGKAEPAPKRSTPPRPDKSAEQ